MSPPVVVWDMGGIMYRYFTEMIVDVGRARGWPIDDLPLGPTHSVPDDAYIAMDRGEITEPEYLATVVTRLAARGIDIDPPADLDWTDELRPSTWQAIDSIGAAGHRQGLLTNDASKWLGAGWWESWPLGSHFDAVVDIQMVGVRKPSPQPYLAICEELSVAPERSLFVDDMTCNCLGAEAVGMESLWYDITDPEGSMARLLFRLGIEDQH